LFKTIGENMSITNNFPVHTGTFFNKKGEKRTMSFIKMNDLPTSITSLFKRSRNLQPGFETVYDVNLGQYRTFNHNTAVGKISVTQRAVTIQS
tara:strand:+ start:2126 stop:2404 length:279 start_codon:yes stop_codon:yes gene_type:complete